MKHMSHRFSAVSDGWLLSEKLRLRIMVFTFPIAFFLGAYGYSIYHADNETVGITNAFYHSAQLFILTAPYFSEQVPWSLEIARWLAAASTLLVLVNTALYLFHRERMELVLNRKKNHAIVCGLGRRGMAVVEMLHQKGDSVVAVENHPEPDIEERLYHMGIPLILGDATRKEILHEARIQCASSLYALCPDDTTNCAIAMAAHNVDCSSNKSRQCFIHINEAELRSALQINHAAKAPDEKQALHFIDAYGPEAMSLLNEGFPIDHDGISPKDLRKAHLVILGFGQMGRTVAIKAAQIGQFANKSRCRISVIDRRASTNESDLLFHHPFITDTADFSFHAQEVLSPKTRKMLEDWCNEPNMIVNVVVCFDDQAIALDAVFNLLPVFNKKNVRVAVRVQQEESLLFLLKGAESKKYRDLVIFPFGIEKSFETLTNPGLNITERFAMDIHKAYVDIIRDQFKNDPNELKRREESGELKEWNELNEDFRESNRQQAIHNNIKLRAVGLEIVDLSDPRPAVREFEKETFDILAEMEHSRWMAERIVNNWKYGDPSDKPNRVNKNIVDWHRLTADIQKYDYDAVALIPELLEKVGRKIVKKEINKNY